MVERPGSRLEKRMDVVYGTFPFNRDRMSSTVAGVKRSCRENENQY